jgi:hypothetical protein
LASTFWTFAELARLTGQSPQNLNAKLKRESFSISELDEIAKSLGISEYSGIRVPPVRKWIPTIRAMIPVCP